MLKRKMLTAAMTVFVSAVAACTAWAEPQGADIDAVLVETAPYESAQQEETAVQTSDSEESDSSYETAPTETASMTKLEQLRNAGPGVSGSNRSVKTVQSGSLTHVDDETVICGGITYKKGAYQGSHKLSGYTWSEQYGNMTASGKGATSNHTVAYSSSLPLGTQIIVEYSNGPLDSRYDSVYTIEDRGDYHIESEGWIDIFFDSYSQACEITDKGWNYANVWIALAQ